MSQEFTFYALFILLTVSMGVVFQFMLAKIKALNKLMLPFAKGLLDVLSTLLSM